jgi:hypothetical protein
MLCLMPAVAALREDGISKFSKFAAKQAPLAVNRPMPLSMIAVYRHYVRGFIRAVDDAFSTGIG